jgi:TolB-like protein
VIASVIAALLAVAHSGDPTSPSPTAVRRRPDLKIDIKNDLEDLQGALPSNAKTRLAIMALSAAGVPEEYAIGLTETIATHAANTGVFDVISPRQIQSLLAYEKRKELLGGCVEEACYVQIAQIVRADHLLAGTVAKVGDEITLNLVLLDTAKGSALKRTTRETTNASELMAEAKGAAIVVLQPVLSERRGFLKIAANVPDVEVAVDDERRIEGQGQIIPLAAGPHVLKVTRDGFYGSTSDVFVRPGRVSDEEVKLIPAKATVEAYESKAKLMRYGGYAAAVAAVGAGVVAGVFYAKATDNKNTVDHYVNALDSVRASGSVGTYDEARSADSSFSTNQTIYLVSLATAVIAGAASLYCLLAGDDPHRYDEFHSLTK